MIEEKMELPKYSDFEGTNTLHLRLLEQVRLELEFEPFDLKDDYVLNYEFSDGIYSISYGDLKEKSHNEHNYVVNELMSKVKPTKTK